MSTVTRGGARGIRNLEAVMGTATSGFLVARRAKNAIPPVAPCMLLHAGEGKLLQPRGR
jgi:hypothetical protein